MSALLGDSPLRDYAHKLERFNAFAAPELRRLIGDLGLPRGGRVLDAGCGTGEALHWLSEAVGPTGRVVGWDLSAAHVGHARRFESTSIEVAQCDLLQSSLGEPADLVWCVNTLNHFADRVAAARHLARQLRAGGRIAVGQSSLLPDMLFAWDARLERLVNEAVRRFYRERYALEEQDLKAVRALVGTLRAAGLAEVAVHSVLIERTSPLDEASRRYLSEAIFGATLRGRLAPYLAADDAAELERLCDPEDEAHALRRPDFHFLQTFTLVTARRAARGVSQSSRDKSSTVACG